METHCIVKDSDLFIFYKEKRLVLLDNLITKVNYRQDATDPVLIDFFVNNTGNNIMTTLREKMKQEMTLIGLANSTQEYYLKSVIQLRDYYNRSPAKLSTAEVRGYLLHLKKRIGPLIPTTFRFMR